MSSQPPHNAPDQSPDERDSSVAEPRNTGPSGPAPKPMNGSIGVPPTTPNNGGEASSSEGTIVQAEMPIVPLNAGLPQIPGYVVEEEIARGGMGMVLAARDPSLGRDVAIKMLKPGYTSEEAARRFVLESKITARLPHPAIPPVYELGTLPDGQPFLAMKLIRGRTLAAELRDIDREAALPRFVQLFEQIAQAVGFAHSQHVIHRDLKPANVMVGAFGEVQVMDWGLAKEVRDTGNGLWNAEPDAEPHSPIYPEERDSVHTNTGIAMGTPAYMAPEQARGEAIGPSADVFALGGILCDILTGCPPFVGWTLGETMLKAGAGDMAAALLRLDSCAADGELVALCRRLLSLRAEDRPQDGKAVAEEVAAYRAGVEERLRKAETERAAAEVRAIEQRKKRRVVMSLAAALVSLIGLLGLGAWWQEKQTAKQRLAEELQGQAERERLARNAEAIEGLLRQCEDRLRQRDSDRAGEALAQIDKRFAEGGGDVFADRIARCRTELELLKELDNLNDREWAIFSGQYPGGGSLVPLRADVFRRFGIIIGETPLEEAVSKLNAATIREHLLCTLEQILWKEPSAGVLTLLQAADPDPYRNTVRLAVKDKDVKWLRELARKEDALQQPIRFAIVIGRDTPIPRDRRVEILHTIHRRERSNFDTLMSLAAQYPVNTQEFAQERVGWYRAALALRPRNVAALNNLGAALHDAGDVTKAVAAWNDAIRLDPKFVRPHCNLGTALYLAGDVQGAIAAWKDTIKLDPTFALVHSNLGVALRQGGDVAGAIAAQKEAIRLDPKLAQAHSALGQALDSSGDRRGAEAAYKEAIRQDSTYVHAYHNLSVLFMRAGDLPGAIAWAREAIRVDKNYASAYQNLGVALYTTRDLKGAVAAFKEAIRLDPKSAKAHSGLGVALLELGDFTGAIASCKEAVRLDPNSSSERSHLGAVLKTTGDLPGAIAQGREAVRLDPNNALAHYSLASTYFHNNQHADAIASAKEALRVDPNYANAHGVLGVALTNSGDIDGGKKSLTEAIRLDAKTWQPYWPKLFPIAVAPMPRSASAKLAAIRHKEGRELEAKGDRAGAIAAYRAAIKIDPTFTNAHINLGDVLLLTGDLDGAEAASKAAIALEPERGLAHANLALVYILKKRYTEAIASAREAVRLNPKTAETHGTLGLALREVGDYQSARTAFAEAVRLDPKTYEPLFRKLFPPPIAPPPRPVMP